MRNSKTKLINIPIILFLGFCIFLAFKFSKNVQFVQKDCENNAATQNNQELMINGAKLSDLKNLQFPPISPLAEPPDTRNTLQLTMFAFNQNCGLGQILFELAALLGISATLDRVPIISYVNEGKIIDRMNRRIRSQFPEFADKFVEKDVQLSDVYSVNFNIRQCCVYEKPETLKPLVQQHVLLKGVYFRSYKYFRGLKSQIRRLLTTKPMNSIRAEAIIPNEFRRDFLVCVHVKQPEIADIGLSKPSEPLFTRAATDFLVERYQSFGKSVTVAVLGNGLIWAHDLFSDKIGKSIVPSSEVLPEIENSPNYTAILTPGVSESDDLAFSQKFCDVVFLSAPTSAFGWWMGYLAKETAQVYYRDPLEVKDQITAEMEPEDYFPANWLKMTSEDVLPKKGNLKP